MTQQRLHIIDRITHDEYDDISYDKLRILHDLYQDSDLYEILHNQELEDAGASPEDYRDVNIFSYMKVPGPDDPIKNYVCFEINDVKESDKNNLFKRRLIKFRTISHEQNIQTEYGINRQDLLALLIKDRLNWSNLLGMQLKKIYDAGTASDNGYYYRNIHYLTTVPNSLQKGTANNFTAR